MCVRSHSPSFSAGALCAGGRGHPPGLPGPDPSDAALRGAKRVGRDQPRGESAAPGGSLGGGRCKGVHLKLWWMFRQSQPALPQPTCDLPGHAWPCLSPGRASRLGAINQAPCPWSEQQRFPFVIGQVESNRFATVELPRRSNRSVRRRSRRSATFFPTLSRSAMPSVSTGLTPSLLLTIASAPRLHHT